MDGVLRVATFHIIFDDVFHYPFVELVSIVYDMLGWWGVRGSGSRRREVYIFGIVVDCQSTKYCRIYLQNIVA